MQASTLIFRVRWVDAAPAKPGSPPLVSVRSSTRFLAICRCLSDAVRESPVCPILWLRSRPLVTFAAARPLGSWGIRSSQKSISTPSSSNVRRDLASFRRFLIVQCPRNNSEKPAGASLLGRLGSAENDSSRIQQVFEPIARRKFDDERHRCRCYLSS
jgi:hypothetical protein